MQSHKLKPCPVCSYENDLHARRCANPKCGTKLDPVPEPFALEIHTGRVIPDLNRYKRWFVPAIFVVLLLILLPVMVHILPGSGKNSVPTSTTAMPTSAVTHPPLPAGLGEVTDSHRDRIGVNDGSFPPFDVGRDTQEMQYKEDAVQQLQAGNSAGASSLWESALSVANGSGSNDAEVLIYLENQKVLNSGKNHITLIVGTAFPDKAYQSILQGTYVAQHEFNQDPAHLFSVRILVANTGSSVDAVNAPDVAMQIVQIARKDPTVVGVVGWLHSVITFDALQILASAKIPLISQQSTSDLLTDNVSPYFFRVVAPNIVEARIAVSLVEDPKSSVHAVRPVIFVDHSDPYSQNLTQDIESQFKSDNYAGWHEELFTTDASNAQAKFAALMQDAQKKYQPDLLIFTGRSNADTGKFQNALPSSGPLAQIPILAGSGSYNAEGKSPGHSYFIAVAYHDVVNNIPIVARFKQEYRDDFNKYADKSSGYYGYTLADDHAMVAYDATALTLQAVDTLYKGGKTQPTPRDLASELPNITGANAFQGVSGQIAFGPDHNPINKALELLFVSKAGIQLNHIYGCFLKGCASK